MVQVRLGFSKSGLPRREVNSSGAGPTSPTAVDSQHHSRERLTGKPAPAFTQIPNEGDYDSRQWLRKYEDAPAIGTREGGRVSLFPRLRTAQYGSFSIAKLQVCRCGISVDGTLDRPARSRERETRICPVDAGPKTGRLADSHAARSHRQHGGEPRVE